MSTTATSPFDADRVRRLLSAQRMAPYLAHADRDPVRALELYEWSGEMAAAAFETVAHLEVVMRNSIDMVLSDHFQERTRGIPWFLLHPPMSEEGDATIDATRARLRPLGHDTRHQIVAGVSFGFWSGLLGPRYEDLWRSAIRHAFPNSTGARKQISAPVSAIRTFRNRLAHHDSMLNVDIPFEIRRVIGVVDHIDHDTAAWLRSVDRTSAVYSNRPHSPIDTVVVPAKNAWPFYQQHYAYVCQPGRSFRPVDRIAFYADHEVKADVPRIVERRDHVSWTAQEEQRLLSSTDRADRKIGAIIAASRGTGGAVGTSGTNQVFILTRPQDPSHRTLGGPLPHAGHGPGSAFVQRQRYASLHALEIASTTADL